MCCVGGEGMESIFLILIVNSLQSQERTRSYQHFSFTFSITTNGDEIPKEEEEKTIHGTEQIQTLQRAEPPRKKPFLKMENKRGKVFQGGEKLPLKHIKGERRKNEALFEGKKAPPNE